MGGTAGIRREAKNEREGAKAAGAAAAAAKAEDDEHWAANSNPKSKAAAKKDAAGAADEEREASRAEAKRLQKLEEEEMGTVSAAAPNRTVLGRSLFLSIIPSSSLTAPSPATFDCCRSTGRRRRR